MTRRTRREIELSEAMLAIWEAASGAIADQERGHASYVNLTDTLRAIADDAAEALADLTFGCASQDD
jgi:hypothetical protein